ncbi:MAG: mevalonate kinase [Polyangiales bacterium]
MRVAASAPGKMLIAGEYVVLDKAPAIVSAVQRRALASWTDDADDPGVARTLDEPEPRFPEAAAARLMAEEQLGVKIPGFLTLDVSALRGPTKKLGVGSSAAAAAAAAAAVFASAGKDLTDDTCRGEVLDVALRAHMAVAPRGSGVDVAGAVLGNTTRYIRDPLKAEPIHWPIDLIARVVWTKKEASTRVFLDKLAGFRSADPDGYEACMKRLKLETNSFSMCFGGRSAESIIQSIPALVAALKALGEASGADIVEDCLEEIAGIAQTHNGAAKSSGAGGGDVCLAFFGSEDDAKAFDASIAETSYEVLHVELGGEGVRAEANPT